MKSKLKLNHWRHERIITDNKMNARQFFDLVTNMRHAQTMYFRTKNAKWLNDAKVFEKRVDDEINRVEQILNPKPQWKEGEIF